MFSGRVGGERHLERKVFSAPGNKMREKKPSISSFRPKSGIEDRAKSIPGVRSVEKV